VRPLFSIILVSSAAALGAADRPGSGQGAPVGLDHIPVAVADLEAASERYRALGFVLKPGRPHPNGIRNQHVKFPDGTEIELITAPESRDDLTATYRKHLANGDGAAFLALFVAPATAARLEAPDYVFFGGLNHSPTDRPEDFAHSNGADALVGVWIAGGDLARERRLLQALGARLAEQTAHVPTARTATVATLPDGDEVVLLPASRQLVAGRPIVGATIRVKNLATARRVLAAVPGLEFDAVLDRDAGRVFLPPTAAHGMWLELRQILR
jgi:catechol 2,3-dioxygenase-like lactoylglutathione lyase family enzyme